MRKKFLILTLALALSFSACACGSDSPSEKDSIEKDIDESEESKSDDSKSEESKSEESKSEESKSEESKSEESKSEESSVAVESSESAVVETEKYNTIAEWYNSNDRVSLEAQVNSSVATDTLKFSYYYEEPSTLLYIYTYDSLASINVSVEEFVEKMDGVLENNYKAFISDIRSFNTKYNFHVDEIKIVYDLSDGTLLFTKSFTEDYVPKTVNNDTTESSSAYTSLLDWINSAEAQEIMASLNSDESIIQFRFRADGTVFVYELSYKMQMDFSTYTQEDINALFDESLAASVGESLAPMITLFKQEYGFEISDVLIELYNYDKTVVYSRLLSELQR